MAALEARVDKLETGAVVAADLVGTYAATIFALDLQGDPAARVQTETAVGTITLHDDPTRTVTVTGNGAHCALLQSSGAWGVACDPNETGAFSASAFWSIDQGGSLVIQDGAGNDFINDPNFIGAGGRVIISGGTGDSTGQPTPEIYSLIMILIKLPPTPPAPTE
jgi:hypothetical protein